jgi:hypothetical protein
MREVLRVFGFPVVIAAGCVLICGGQAEGVSSASYSAVGKAPVDNQARQMLYATGEGAVPSSREQPNRAKAYLQGKTYAKMDAVANLVKMARGTMISYCSTGSNHVAETSIKEEIKGVMESVQVMSVKKRPEGKDTIVEVTVRAPAPRPVKAVEKELPAKQADESANVPSWIARADQPARRQADGYSGLVINAQGLRLVRCMSPKILRPDGSEVWGTVKADYDFVSDYGIVGYALSLGEAISNRRAGDRPLVLRAMGRGDSASKGDLVVSREDAELILAEDRRSGFLRDFRVIIVVDQAPASARRR